MNKRQVAPVQAFRRLMAFLDESPALADIAKRSAAYEELRVRVAELTAFLDDFHGALARRPVVREHLAAKRRELKLLAQSIIETGKLGRYEHRPELAALRMPRDTDPFNFALSMTGLINLARDCHTDLVALGMVADRPDHLAREVAHYSSLTSELDSLDRTIAAGTQGYPFMLDRARQTSRVLFLQIRPLVAPEALGQWKGALHLGRFNKRTIASAPVLALPNPEATVAPA